MRAGRASLGAAVMVATLGVTGCAAESRTPSTAEPVDSPEPADTDDTDDTVYRDGDYSATGWYGSLPSHHDVTLSIEGDTVTAVEISTPAEDSTSLGYQQRFAAALPEAIVGRGVDDLAVDRIAGSSGCSEGFMDALAQITEQARKGTS